MPELDSTRRHFIEVYSIRSERLLHRFPIGGHTGALSLSRDGSRVAVAVLNTYGEGFRGRSSDPNRQLLSVYNTRNGALLFKLKTPEHNSRYSCISPCNRLIATAANDNNLEVWEITGGGQRLKFKLPGDVTAILRKAFMAMHRDPDYLAENERMKSDISPLGGEEVQALVERIGRTPNHTSTNQSCSNVSMPHDTHWSSQRSYASDVAGAA